MSEIIPFDTTYLGTHCFIRTGKKDVNEGDKSGIYPFFTCSKNYTYSNSFSFDTEALLVAGNGEVGNVEYYHGKFEAYQRTYVIDKFNLNIRYIYHYLKHQLKGRLSQTYAGSVINFIKLGDLTKFEINHPKLSIEQAKVAEILDTLDTAIHETEAIIAKLKAIKQGLLHDLLTRGIDANGELRPPQAEAPHLYKESPLGWIPREWNSQELHEMVATDSPITYGVVQPGPEIEGGVPFIRGGDIYGGRILVEQLRTISQRISNGYRRTKLRGGELLMSLVGYPGEVGIVPIGLAGANIARQAALIRLADPALASYVMHYLSSKGGKRQILGQSLGSAQQVVNLGDLRTVQIPLPLPDESAEVACRIGAANQRIDQEIGELNKLRKLKAALMDDLLTGRVRVTPLLVEASQQ